MKTAYGIIRRTEKFKSVPYGNGNQFSMVMEKEFWTKEQGWFERLLNTPEVLTRSNLSGKLKALLCKPKKKYNNKIVSQTMLSRNTSERVLRSREYRHSRAIVDIVDILVCAESGLLLTVTYRLCCQSFGFPQRVQLFVWVLNKNI